MPVSSAQLYPTAATARKSYLPPSSGYNSSKSSLYSGSYYQTSRSRFGLGDDSTSTSRFGVSSRYSTSSSTTLSSSSRINSIDKDYRKPPIGYGSRLRSESLTRDKTLDSLTNSSSTNSIKRQTASSLARSVATSGADIIEKYSVANYKPNCELSRSRSLSESTANKLVDSINSSSRSASRASSKDRANSYSSNNSISNSCTTTKDYLNNSTPTSSSTLSKVNSNATYNSLTNQFTNKQCLITNNNNNALSVEPVVVSSLTNNNNFNNKRSLLTHNTSSIGSSTLTNGSNLINTTTTNSNTTNTNGITTGLNKPLKVATITFDTTNVHRAITHKSTISSTTTKPTTINNVNINTINNNNTIKETTNKNSTSHNLVGRGNSIKPLISSYKKSDFLKCEYDLARSQLVKSSSSIPNGNNNLSISTTTTTTNNNIAVTVAATPTTTTINSTNNSNINSCNSLASNIHKLETNNNFASSIIAPSDTSVNKLGRGGQISSIFLNGTHEGHSNNSQHNNLYVKQNQQAQQQRIPEYQPQQHEYQHSSKRKIGDFQEHPTSTSMLKGTLDQHRYHSYYDTNQTSESVVCPYGQGSLPAGANCGISNGAGTLGTAIVATNGGSTINMNCTARGLNNTARGINNTTELFDDIKFIDCDESERKHSPTTTTTTKFSTARDIFNEQSSTLPSTIGKRTTDINTNKYNTITNNMKALHQYNNIQITNGTPKKASSEDLMSSTSSSSSTLSATASSTSSINQEQQKAKNCVLVKIDSQKNDETVDNIRSNSLWDRDTKSVSTPNRTLSDSDALKKSFASSSISDKADDSDGLCGLRNIGNTCFMNSVIQCLSHTSELTRNLRTKIDIRTTTKDQRIVSEFAKLIKEMWTSGTRSVTPSELKSAFSCKHRMYSGCAQQDAQEFLRFFLDSLHCALNVGTTGEKLEIDDNLSNNKKADLTWEWYSKVENSIIKDLFVGQLKSSLKCTVCGNTSVTFDPFWDLSVPLPSPSSSRCKLETCLDLFIKEEILDGDEMPTCSKCKTRRKCTKSFTIQRFPKYLVIHLKRFSETRWSKLSNTVEFPTSERELNMAPYAANASSSATYTLYGISNHMGSTAGGHYVALCKHPITRKWHEFNDNAVTSTSESSLVSSSAYLLFYERTDNKKNYNSTHPHRINRYMLLNHSFKRLTSQDHFNELMFKCNQHCSSSQTEEFFQINSLNCNKTTSMTSSHFVINSIFGIILYSICILLYCMYR